MDTTMVIFWAIAFGVFVVAEVATLNALVSIWFAVGSLGAMFFAMADLDFVWQMVMFVGLSTVVLIATRPLVKKMQGRRYATNFELDIGKTCTVIEPINNQLGQGRVKLDGTDWSARSEDGSPIEAGTVVTVKMVDGAKLIVAK
ncbi:MAG: NfeD family protein [Ruminococcus sp.]|nr:NfeD family protein [Ruminococcus sp.]